MAKSNIYTTPPYWFTSNPKNKDVVLKLEKNGWRAYYPSGRTELIVGMTNIPEEYLTGKAKVQEEAPAPKVEEPVAEEPKVEEEPKEEAPKKKSRSKKTATTEE